MVDGWTKKSVASTQYVVTRVKKKIKDNAQNTHEKQRWKPERTVLYLEIINMYNTDSTGLLVTAVQWFTGLTW